MFYCTILYPLQKRKERSAALEKVDMPESSKSKWRKILTNDFMSSEESTDEEQGHGSDDMNRSGTRVRVL